MFNRLQKLSSNIITNRGDLIIDSGLFINNTNVVGAGAVYGIDNYSSNSKVFYNGGKMSSLTVIRQFVTSETAGNDVVMNGGIIEGGWGIQIQASTSKPKANLIVNNGTINSTSIGIYLYNVSTVENNISLTLLKNTIKYFYEY